MEVCYLNKMVKS